VTITRSRGTRSVSRASRRWDESFRRGRERAKQAPHVLARVELSDVEDVAAGHAKARSREGATVVRRRRIEVAVDCLRDNGHAFLWNTQPLDDVLLRGLGHGDHRVGAPG
jgi:hypothetical protein